MSLTGGQTFPHHWLPSAEGCRRRAGSLYHKRAKTAPDGIYSDRHTVRETEHSTRCSSRACSLTACAISTWTWMTSMYCSSKLTVLTYRTKMQGKRIRHSDIVHGVACRARCVYRMSCPVKRRPDRRPEPEPEPEPEPLATPRGASRGAAAWTGDRSTRPDPTDGSGAARAGFLDRILRYAIRSYNVYRQVCACGKLLLFLSDLHNSNARENIKL